MHICTHQCLLTRDGIYADVTAGCGGHVDRILARTSDKAKFILSDIDPVCVEVCRHKFKREAGRMVFAHSDFSHLGYTMKSLLKHLGEPPERKIDAMVVDFGLNSIHIDDASRGFSYKNDGVLDMRMNAVSNALRMIEETREEDVENLMADFFEKTKNKSEQIELFNNDAIQHFIERINDHKDLEIELRNIPAFYIVNYLRPEILTYIFLKFGEEKFARYITTAIVNQRAKEVIYTTAQLGRLISDAIPMRGLDKMIKTKSKIFQALRICINGELTNIHMLLSAIHSIIKKDGRIAILTYHRLEDQIIKRFFKAGSCFDSPPCFLQLHNKPIIPTADEVTRNPRARSAKLRIGVKVV